MDLQVAGAEVVIETQGRWASRDESHLRRAGLELEVGLRRLGVRSVRHGFAAGEGQRRPATEGERLRVRLAVDPVLGSETYRLALQEATEVDGLPLSVVGGSGRAVFFGVCGLLERQGVFFGIDGPVYPLELPRTLALPDPHADWQAGPSFKVRGLLPWPDFLNCVTVFNREDHRAYLENLSRMRLNFFGLHIYTGASKWAESFTSFEFAGTGHAAALDTTASDRWGYLPVRTSCFGFGSHRYFDGEVFGADAERHAATIWEKQERAQDLWRESLAYARQLGIKTCVGFEPMSLPDEIQRALPPECRLADGRVDPESRTFRKLLESRLGALLEQYPMLDYVWLWEDEGASWGSQQSEVPLSVTPFRVAHDFLRRHSPGIRLVISGWGGVTRHFRRYHELLPPDIVFSGLLDQLGWQEVDPVYGELGDRERWPIPWLEDDPGMWVPQFHAHRFARDVGLAERYGCPGLIGIHWRHRIVDPTAGFFARRMWDGGLKAETYYRAYARAHAAGERAAGLAEVLDDVDRGEKVLPSFTGEVRGGRPVIKQTSGDYGEAFNYWEWARPADVQGGPGVADSAPPLPNERVAELEAIARRFEALATAAGSGDERERLGYLAGHVRFTAHYARCLQLGGEIQEHLQRALAARRADGARSADAHVAVLARPALVPWRELAARVRDAILAFQRIVATRNDLGTLASLNVKLARLGLDRMRLSLAELLGDVPDLDACCEEARRADSDAPRVIVPTRPTLLRTGERLRVQAIAAGVTEPEGVDLVWRDERTGLEERRPMQLLGRRTFAAELGPCWAEGVFSYHAAVRCAGGGANVRSVGDQPLLVLSREGGITG